MIVRKHAAIRIQERCLLSVNDIRQKLMSGKYYPIGADTSSEHVHKMIYSERDQEFYVVVEDYDNNEIITLLPLEYHNSWRLSHEDLEQAKYELSGLKYEKPEIVKEVVDPNEANRIAIEKQKNSDVPFVVIKISVSVSLYHKIYNGRIVKSNAKAKDIEVVKMTKEEIVGMGFPSDSILNYYTFSKEYGLESSLLKDNFLNKLDEIARERNLPCGKFIPNVEKTNVKYYMLIGGGTFSFGTLKKDIIKG